MILAIDPGDTTGFALMDVHDKRVVVVDTWEQPATDIPTTARFLNARIRQWGITHIVVEEYRIYKSHINHHINSNVPTLQLIGAIKAIASMHIPPVPVKMYGAQKKSRWPDKRLARYNIDGLDEVKKNSHGWDAVLIGLTYYEEGEMIQCPVT